MKRIILASAALALTLTLSACGQKNITLDPVALATELTALCTDSLFELDEDTASTLYGGIRPDSMTVWSSGGVLADEVAVFQSADGETAAEVLSVAQQRIADQTTAYATYDPNETAKLEAAIVEQHGNYVVVCVSTDSEQARTIIDGYVK